MWRWCFPLVTLGLTGCVEGEAVQTDVMTPSYLGAEVLPLDDELVNVRVEMADAESKDAVAAYARCAVAQFALDRDYGFARHVRTNIDRKGGVWRGDAIYTLSASRPAGLMTIEAEEAVRDCTAQGIPTT